MSESKKLGKICEPSKSSNMWWTKQARIQTEKRLLSNAFQSQLILLWYSFFSVCVSIYYLKNSTSDSSPVAWVIYSVLVLCMSGFINGLSFKERSVLVKNCYEYIQNLCSRMDQLNDNNDMEINEIKVDYKKILDSCENHTTEDYCMALCATYKLSLDASKLDRHPQRCHWVIAGFYCFKRLLMLSTLYVLPVAICFFIKS